MSADSIARHCAAPTAERAAVKSWSMPIDGQQRLWSNGAIAAGVITLSGVIIDLTSKVAMNQNQKRQSRSTVLLVVVIHGSAYKK